MGMAEYRVLRMRRHAGAGPVCNGWCKR